MGCSERRRVAILGGGAGGLTAAFELTATPELRERYDVTVYQLGWRLGGKGASGRREIGPHPAAMRIEEHGLHVWFGFYENAFDVIRRVYEELDRPADAPLRTWRDAFHPTNDGRPLRRHRGRSLDPAALPRSPTTRASPESPASRPACTG